MKGRHGMDYSVRAQQAGRRIVGGSERWTARSFERVAGGLIVRGCEVPAIGPKGGREPDYTLPLTSVFVSEVEIGRETGGAR